MASLLRTNSRIYLDTFTRLLIKCSRSGPIDAFQSGKRRVWAKFRAVRRQAARGSFPFLLRFVYLIRHWIALITAELESSRNGAGGLPGTWIEWICLLRRLWALWRPIEASSMCIHIPPRSNATWRPETHIWAAVGRLRRAANKKNIPNSHFHCLLGCSYLELFQLWFSFQGVDCCFIEEF